MICTMLEPCLGSVWGNCIQKGTRRAALLFPKQPGQQNLVKVTLANAESEHAEIAAIMS